VSTIPEIPGAKTAEVNRFLHVNLNCASLERSRDLYTSVFGLREVMYNESVDSDGSLMDMPGRLDSKVSFLYDRRGARRSPSLELVEWGRPDLNRIRYEQPYAIGMQTVAFTVPSVESAVADLARFGVPMGSVTGDGDGITLFMDDDGVTVELHEDVQLEQPLGRHVRLSVGDIERSQRWYEAIGLEARGPAVTREWTWSAPGTSSPVKATVTTVTMSIPNDQSYAVELTQWLDPISEGTPKQGGADQGLFRMALGVEDTRAAGVALRAAGWPFAGEPKCHVLADTPLPDLWITFTKDPDGITVELVERPVATYEAKQ
jgi:catechol 2,3-dioxygenase-like lactoylglutathione lyase family enzyme